MDPFSITAGVVGIAAAVCQSSKKLVGLVDSIKEGPEQIQAISRDARAFQTIVYSLHSVLKEQDVHFLVHNDADLIHIIGNLALPLGNCQDVLHRLTVKLNAYLKPSSDGQGFRMKWGSSAKSQIRDLMTELGWNKDTLNNALGAINT